MFLIGILYLCRHSLLFDYGVPENGSEFSPDDADADLVPGLVEKVALPILHHDIAHCWDMLSARETKNAVSATSLIINYVPASSEALKELIATIRDRLAEAVSDLVVCMTTSGGPLKAWHVLCDMITTNEGINPFLWSCGIGPCMECCCDESCAKCCKDGGISIWCSR